MTLDVAGRGKKTPNNQQIITPAHTINCVNRTMLESYFIVSKLLVSFPFLCHCYCSWHFGSLGRYKHKTVIHPSAMYTKAFWLAIVLLHQQLRCYHCHQTVLNKCGTTKRLNFMLPSEGKHWIIVAAYIQATSMVISGQVLTCDSTHPWRLLEFCSTGKSGHQHHDLIFHSVTLSWHYANQSLLSPINTKHQGRKRQESSL